jgi:hypothetical protein
MDRIVMLGVQLFGVGRSYMVSGVFTSRLEFHDQQEGG